MEWCSSWRTDRRIRPLADRHYSRQSIGADNFVPPGRCLVLRTELNDCYWVTSWPYAEYVKHEWAGAWICSAFRKERPGLASELIRQAVAATRWYWPEIPDLGMVTFVDASKVRHKRDPGRCFLRAGFKLVGTTKGGLLAFQMSPDEMPPAEMPMNVNLSLFDEPQAWRVS